MISLFVVSMLHAAPPMIDPAVHELLPCRLAGVSFVTRNDGWVTTRCGDVYVTHDGGRGWARDLRLEAAFGHDVDGTFKTQHLEFIRWFSPTDGIAGGYIGGRILRTTDAGASWTAAPLSEGQWLYSAFTLGSSAWVCGSSGTIERSDDRGRTWRRMASPFNNIDRCMSLSFDASGRGEAAGMNGSHWTTRDGAGAWKHVDGTPDGTKSLSGPPYDVVPGAQPSETCTLGDLKISIDDDRVVFDAPGAARTASPLLSPGSNERVPLVAVERRDGGLYGWTSKSFLRSDDEKTWYVVSELPAPALRATFVSRTAVVLESDQGVYRSESSGRRWQLSTQPDLDLADALHVRTGATSPNPLACVATAHKADLAIKLENQGCFGGDSKAWSLAVSDGRATTTDVEGKHPLEPAAAKELIAQLGARITRLEAPSDCSSTTLNAAELTWSCDGAPARTLRFDSYSCGGSEEHVGGSTIFANGPNAGYARALGIGELIRSRLAPASP